MHKNIAARYMNAKTPVNVRAWANGHGRQEPERLGATIGSVTTGVAGTCSVRCADGSVALVPLVAVWGC